jgi:outer membrane protein TolC
MISTSRLCRQVGILFICGIWLVSASPGSALENIGPGVNGRPDSSNSEDVVRPEPVAAPGEIAASQTLRKPMKITIEEAILVSLENNQALVVERLNPAIRKTYEDQEKAVFDPQLNAEIAAGRDKARSLTISGDGVRSDSTDSVDGSINIEQFFPTGTTIALEGSTGMEDSVSYRNRFYSARLGMTVTQAILRGYGAEVNLASLRQAVLETRMSEYELRGYTEFLVARVEQTYWDFALARRQIEIYEESLKLARQQLVETEELIAVGRLAEAEVPAVQAEVAAQEQGLINARSNMESIRLELLRLLNPPGPGLWEREIVLIHQPTLPEIKLDDVRLHVAVAMRMRPVLNEARLGVLRDDLELVKTRNGLLPLMDLFMVLGKSGYADSFGASFSDLDGDSYDVLFGVQLQYPLRNREAKALHKRARLSRVQAQKALQNLSQLVEVDVRTAYIEVNRTKQQISASSATRKFDEEKLRIETEKFRVGRSTSFLLAQAQRDLLVSRITEVQTLASYLKALVDLYYLDGSLLERRGISASGREPVELPIN